jgi:hypothetical protein
MDAVFYPSTLQLIGDQILRDSNQMNVSWECASLPQAAALRIIRGSAYYQPDSIP